MWTKHNEVTLLLTNTSTFARIPLLHIIEHNLHEQLNPKTWVLGTQVYLNTVDLKKYLALQTTKVVFDVQFADEFTDDKYWTLGAKPVQDIIQHLLK